MITLFKNQTSDGFSPIIQLTADQATRKIVDGNRVILPTGVFGGATVTFRISATGKAGTFGNLVANGLTNDTSKIEFLPNELYVQAETTGSTGTTDLNLHIA